MAPNYSYEFYQSIDDVDAEEWQDVCHASNNLFLDPRFLKAVDLSFSDEAEFWYVVFRDEHRRAVAATCFSRYLVDCALMSPKVIQNLAASVRRVWKRFLKYRILLCGLPLSTCDCQLAIADDADMEAIVAGLNQAATELARKTGSRLTSFKEFSVDLTTRLSGLSRYGFLKARSVYAYHLEGGVDSFSSYLASRTAAARTNIRRSLRRFEEAGLTCEQMRGRDGVEHLFTADVHRLYLNVLERAKVRFECVPLRFFQELARQLPDESKFTIVRQGERIVGFCCGISGTDQHVLLILGFDYSLNREADLYFNLIYRALEQGMNPGVQVIHIGAAADEFKQRIGCHGEWRSIFVKAMNPVSQLLLKTVFGQLFDTRDGANAPPPVGELRVRPMETSNAGVSRSGHK